LNGKKKTMVKKKSHRNRKTGIPVSIGNSDFGQKGLDNPFAYRNKKTGILVSIGHLNGKKEGLENPFAYRNKKTGILVSIGFGKRAWKTLFPIEIRKLGFLFL
jgi:hypothetical protein